MSNFKQPLNIPVSRTHYKLVEEYRYLLSVEGQIHMVIVPEGFVYDGASVPRILWSISGLTKDGLLRGAALVHDFVYHHKGKLPKGSLFVDTEKGFVAIPTHISKKQADKTFKQMMRIAGVGKFKSHIAYLAVRLFGPRF